MGSLTVPSGGSSEPQPRSSPSHSNIVGSPYKFQSGPFSGRIVRSSLEELQKADLGRK